MKAIATTVLLSVCSLSITDVNAVQIVIGSGNPGNSGTDNVLFNDPLLAHEGALVQGNFAGEGLGYVAEFTSTSGSGLLRGSGGQAEVEGILGNDPLLNLVFGLADGATFTKAIFNVDATTDGSLSIAVNYFGASGSPYEELVTLNGNGQNFFYVEAEPGVAISSISLTAENTEIDVARQFRLGGFANAIGVPDGGATAIMLGLGFLGLVGYSARLRG